ncbi:MAG TPA: GTPase Era [Flavobacteriales bacterium]|jgi:GTP-binding protein Era|nr:GTPase Era [Flavobacteriales bacterium]
MHKAGFVNLIGNPNVGKSTLLNQLVGEKLSIISYKAQTTRHRILAISSTDDYQIVYSDLPGIVEPAYELHQSMLKYVKQSLEDADVFLIVTEMGDKGLKNEEISKAIAQRKTPTIVCLNKIDLFKQHEVEAEYERWISYKENVEVIPLSALHGFNVDTLHHTILKHLPESPAYYPKDQITDRSERFIVSEIIREKILHYYEKEIPYSSEVSITEFKREERRILIRSVIHVERDSQKGIIIGHKGKKIKQLGIEARKDIEQFFDKKVFLELFVKTMKNWRNDTNKLRFFGYEN